MQSNGLVSHLQKIEDECAAKEHKHIAADLQLEKMQLIRKQHDCFFLNSKYEGETHLHFIVCLKLTACWYHSTYVPISFNLG